MPNKAEAAEYACRIPQKSELINQTSMTTDENGQPLPADELPLVKTLKNRLPYFKTFWIESLRGKPEKISVTSYPIIGRAGGFLGAVAIFWRPSEA